MTVALAHGGIFPGLTSAFAGAEITSTVDLTTARDFQALDPEVRLEKALDEQAAWLSGLWSLSPRAALEIRYVCDPAAARVRCFALARLDVESSEEVESAVEHWARRLAHVPSHLTAVALEDDALRDALWRLPPSGDARTMAEIRKRVISAPAHRRDAQAFGIHRYVAVLPWPDAPRSWEAIHRAVLNLDVPVVVSTGLGPSPVTGATASFLATAGSLYERFGTELRDPGADGLYASGGQLLGEPFARDAARLYTRALRRYQQHGYRCRVSVWSPERLPVGLLTLIGRTIGPPARRSDMIFDESIGEAFAIATPQVAGDAEAFRANAAYLRHMDWGQDELLRTDWETPGDSEARRAGAHLHLLSVLVDATEATAAARLPVAPTGFLPGFRVEQPTLPTRAFGRSSANTQIDLGRQVVAGEHGCPVWVDLNQLTQHTLITGTTGSGKTNAVLHLLCQLRDLPAAERIPFLVVEPVNVDRNDYRWLLDRYDDVLVLTVGDEECAPLRLNPLEIPAGVLVRTHIANLLTCFDAAFGLWDPLPHIYQRALNETYLRRGFVLSALACPSDADRWPTMADFTRALGREVEQLNYQGEVMSNIRAASVLRAQSLTHGPCGEALDVRRSYPIQALLDRPVIIELGRLGGNLREQAFIMALLLNALTEHYMATRKDDRLSHVTVIEEAHRLLADQPAGNHAQARGDARRQAAEAFAQTLAENRKYGEGMVIVEQIPSKLIVDTLKNTNLKMMFRLPGRDDREVVGATMDLRDDHIDAAGRLDQHHALVRHPDLEVPALVEVPNVRGTSGRRSLPSRDDVRRRFTEFAERPDVLDALRPFTGCDGCQSVCEHRAVAFSRGQTAAPRKQFGVVVGAFHDDPESWPGWWKDVAAAIDGALLDTQVDIHEADVSRDACLFLHLWHSQWGDEPHGWFVNEIRRGATRQ